MLEIFLIVSPLFLFFIIQVTVNKEIPLTIAALVITIFALYQSQNVIGEAVLFISGLIIGLIIEVGLGFVLRTQHFEHASFFGVPYWLPFMWGYGFIVIHRFGDVLLQLIR